LGSLTSVLHVTPARKRSWSRPVCLALRSRVHINTFAGWRASRGCVWSRTWPPLPVRGQQQCAGSAPGQPVAQHDALNGGMASALGDPAGGPPVTSMASSCSVAAVRRTPRGGGPSRSMRWTCVVGGLCWSCARARSTAGVEPGCRSVAWWARIARDALGRGCSPVVGVVAVIPAPFIVERLFE
jgi:hypothetical protein